MAVYSKRIVQPGMRDSPLFAVLPTGGGKSLCFQLPAFVRYQRRCALTIVISPSQALMIDQLDNLRSNTGSPSTSALYGMLTAQERGEVIKGLQVGVTRIAIHVARTVKSLRGLKRSIEHREIGCRVFDEAHWAYQNGDMISIRITKNFARIY